MVSVMGGGEGDFSSSLISVVVLSEVVVSKEMLIGVEPCGIELSASTLSILLSVCLNVWTGGVSWL